jgi:hypothetical protein
MDNNMQSLGGNAQPSAPTMGGFAQVERNEGTVWLTPGLHTVRISKIAYVTPQTSKPFVGITLSTSDGKETTQRFYVSPQAVGTSLVNIVHLLNKAVSDEELNKLQWPQDDYQKMCEVLDAAVPKDVAIEIKLIGEEYNGKINAKFGFRPFAQKPGEDRLVFNPDTDIKREEVADLTSNLQAPPVGATPPPANGGPAAAPGMPGIQVPQ